MNATYLTSARLPEQLPDIYGPEVCVVGRSNCGKSTLLNALFGTTKLVKTSSTAGHTKMINFFRLQAEEGVLHFADLPGYGYSATGKEARAPWEALMESYFCRLAPRFHLFLADARRKFDAEDKALMKHMQVLGPVVIVLTKADKLNQADRQKTLKHLKETTQLPAVLVSAAKGSGVPELRADLWKWAQSLPEPGTPL